ncbi:MAG: TIGR04086 family membrane protein [Anaeroplasmataceae bacterium]|nr:TIGR04086 family membrane protein [Anaeroplasmataceae bacterium]
MKNKLRSGIKIYITIAVFLFVVTGIYTMYIAKTTNNINPIVKLVLTGLLYLLIGFAFGNAVHKKGLLVGLLAGVVHLSLIKLINFLATGNFNINIFLVLISILLAMVGGMLGVNLKKLF